jgi:hypothetical protein
MAVQGVFGCFDASAEMLHGSWASACIISGHETGGLGRPILPMQPNQEVSLMPRSAT